MTLLLEAWSLKGPIQNITSRFQKIFKEENAQSKDITRGWDPMISGLNMNIHMNDIKI